ncbi:MAG: GMC family oxidoreductase [Phycisphaeraceae bacterium]|nr:GMC family oxidoreductase [Phycisphaeraceae bacterium]
MAFRDLLERPLERDVETDLCIIGAGAAGLTIAHMFEGSRLRVCIVESGGRAFDEAVQDMYRGENVGVRYGLETTRLRYLGGSTNHWTGVCGLLDPVDFEPRPWASAPGWPISLGSLLPYYERAHDVLDLGAFEYDPARVAPERKFPAFDPRKLVVRLLRLSAPTRLGQKFADELASSENVLCLLNGSVVDVEVSGTGRSVSGVRVATLNGDDSRVRARAFVLACGGLENARLMLHSSASPTGLGNASGLVGRFFADHLHHPGTSYVVTRGDWWRVFQRVDRGGTRSTPTICLGDEVQRSERLLNARLGLAQTDPKPEARAGAVCLSIFGNVEQQPSEENRVELSDQRDALGVRRIRLRWSPGELDQRTMERSSIILAEELGRLGLGFVRLETMLDSAAFRNRVRRASHHMGTTRMSLEPAAGVVDTNCRVHDVDNFYVAGSSVFPACGQINPTLTIVALAIRLGDHLGDRLE